MSLVEMKVPVIGESVTEVTLSQWLKADGDYVELDEPICEFESDKATLEFPAEASGILKHVAAEGDDLEIGALVARIDTSAEKSDGGNGAEKKESEAEPAKTEKKADKQPEEQPAEAATAGKGGYGNGEKLTEKEVQPALENHAGALPDQEQGRSDSYAKGHPSPAASKILSEKDIDPASVSGSGRDGRITKGDALQAADNKAKAPEAKKPEAPAEKAAKPAAPRPSGTFSRGEERRKMSRMRRTIATRLVKAKNETAMLTTFNEVDLSEVMALRTRVQEKFTAKHGIKLGFMSLFAKACAKVLMEMPDVNAMIDGNELIYHDFVDISIAISTPNGLVVPPVRNVESLSFAEIELAIKDLSTKARNGNLSIEEMQGGTFTITNGGVFGSLLSTPIINEPQSAILGMHAIKERPVVIEGKVEVRPMMYLALSYDHRVIDGSTSVTFLVKVKELLEDPTLLLLDI